MTGPPRVRINQRRLKGFTLLELMVVIIIIGVLAGFGLTQYTRVIERSRGAEARAVIGAIRIRAAAIYMQNNNNCMNCTAANVGIGSDYPGPACATTHYFAYVISPGTSGFSAVATRCTAGGKTPNAGAPAYVWFKTDFSVGADDWATSGEY